MTCPLCVLVCLVAAWPPHPPRQVPDTAPAVTWGVHVLFPAHCFILPLTQKTKSQWVHLCLRECLYMYKRATAVWVFELSQILMLKRNHQCQSFGRGDFGERSTFTCGGYSASRKDLKGCICSRVVWRHSKKVNQEVFLHETVGESAGTFSWDLKNCGKEIAVTCELPSSSSSSLNGRRQIFSFSQMAVFYIPWASCE